MREIGRTKLTEPSNFDQAIATTDEPNEPSGHSQLQRKQRTALFIVLAAVLVAGVGLQSLEAGWIAAYAGWRAEILFPFFTVAAFLGGMVIAKIAKPLFSPISVVLIGATVGLLIGFLLNPVPCVIAGSLAGVWISVAGERPWLGLVKFIVFAAIGLCAGAFARLGLVLGGWWICLAVFATAMALLIQTGKLKSTNTAATSQLNNGRFRLKVWANRLLIASFAPLLLFVGWHAEIVGFNNLHSYSGYVPPTAAQANWLWKGIPLQYVGLNSPGAWELKHVANQEYLQGIDLMGVDPTLDMSQLGVLPKVSWLSLSGATGSQMNQLAESLPNVTMLDVRSVRTESDYSFERFNMLGRLYVKGLRVDQQFWDQLDALPVLTAILFDDCDLIASQVPDGIANRITSIQVEKGHVDVGFETQLAGLPALAKLEYSVDSKPSLEMLRTLAASTSLSDLEISLGSFTEETVPSIAWLSANLLQFEYHCDCPNGECQCQPMLEQYQSSQTLPTAVPASGSTAREP